MQAVRHWIYSHTGLHFAEPKLTILRQRLQCLCRELGIPSFQALYQHLQRNDMPNLPLGIARAVSTNHTCFFREPEAFQFFAGKIIPTRPPHARWRIWSAACSSGEEPYTLAIVLAQQLGLAQAARQAAILGTDISRPMIEQAEHGVYYRQRLQKVPEAVRGQFFKPVGLGQWRIIPELQQFTVFRRFNLMSSAWPFKNMFHVIFCRNVFYYFDQPHRRQLTEQLFRVTEPGGWLLTSVTESLRTYQSGWLMIAPGIYQKPVANTENGRGTHR